MSQRPHALLVALTMSFVAALAACKKQEPANPPATDTSAAASMPDTSASAAAGAMATSSAAEASSSMAASGASAP